MAVALDLTGQVFGKLTAINIVKNSKNKLEWFCKCSCGGSRTVVAGSLRFGSVKSCGCLNSLDDLTGRVSGNLTALHTGRNSKNKKIWVCSCKCGGTMEVSPSNFRSGKVKSCGCSKIVGGMEGKVFGKLTVISYAGLQNNKQMWLCKCSCGNDFVAQVRALNAGKNKSCGCNLHYVAAGDVFGRLTAVGVAGRSPRGSVLWNCACTCGGSKIVLSSSLIGDKTKSCGCILGNKRSDGCGDINPAFFNRIKAGATSRGLTFDITIEEIWDLFLKQDKRCALSGVILELQRSYKGTNTASLDRIDSNKGYSMQNVQWVDKNVNMMKRNMLDDTFIEICVNIANYRRK